jgi:hypothetical protein
MGWVIWGSNPGRSKRYLSSQQCPNLLWGPASLLFSWYWGIIKEHVAACYSCTSKELCPGVIEAIIVVM